MKNYQHKTLFVIDLSYHSISLDIIFKTPNTGRSEIEINIASNTSKEYHKESIFGDSHTCTSNNKYHPKYF